MENSNDWQKLSEIMFPNLTKTIEDYESIYPLRDLPKNAKVTRLAPSPTGFIHMGNLYGAFVDERLARQSQGTFILRIEDTDDKRKVDGAVETIISSLAYFGVAFDEGAGEKSASGVYGPYWQSSRRDIYQAAAKHLVAKGLAYPCFCTEEELSELREKQVAANVITGYYGAWAKDRQLSFAQMQQKITAGQKFVVRLKSSGNQESFFTIADAIRGELKAPVNFTDVVILKANGIPTYHFAHVVDDHLMRVTHVVRGEEWLSTLPIHYELFKALSWELPVYCHTAHLMKIDELSGAKRKVSKRKDPELGLEYYMEQGYHPECVREYLLTLLNSNFEEWRNSEPDKNAEEFLFTIGKMSHSGALLDLNKLNDVSKNVLLKIPVAEIYDFLVNWAKGYRPDLTSVLAENRSQVCKLLAVGREGNKPRKDLVYAAQIFAFIQYYFDEYFVVEDQYPSNIDRAEGAVLLKSYLATYDHNDEQSQWFEKIRQIAAENGYAVKPKDYKKHPEDYKGDVGQVSTVIRIAVVGRASSPDVWELQQIMGEEKVRQRIIQAIG